jgi:hypothetical protein
MLIMVSVDGLRATTLADPAAPLPHLRALIERGSRARSLWPVFPSVTWPCHATMVSGVGPARHGVLGNHVFDRARGEVVSHYGDRTEVPIAVETLWARTADAGGRVASVCWPKTRGAAGIADNIPEFYDQDLFEAYASRELWRELRAGGLPIDRYAAWSACHPTTPMQDWLTLEAALHVLATRSPRLMLVHFLTLDAFQHDHGVSSPEAGWAVAHGDALLGRLVEVVTRLGRLETTTFMVFGDHGFVDVDTTYHANQILREERLLDVGAGGVVTRRRAWVAANGGSALSVRAGRRGAHGGGVAARAVHGVARPRGRDTRRPVVARIARSARAPRPGRPRPRPQYRASMVTHRTGPGSAPRSRWRGRGCATASRSATSRSSTWHRRRRACSASRCPAPTAGCWAMPSCEDMGGPDMAPRSAS